MPPELPPAKDIMLLILLPAAFTGKTSTLQAITYYHHINT